MLGLVGDAETASTLSQLAQHLVRVLPQVRRMFAGVAAYFTAGWLSHANPWGVMASS
jgi:hypothetical protein